MINLVFRRIRCATMNGLGCSRLSIEVKVESETTRFGCQRLEFIKCMRTAGLPVEVLIKYFGLVQQGDETMEERKAILVEQRVKIIARMAELQKTLDLLDFKIGFYENALVKKEQELIKFHAE